MEKKVNILLIISILIMILNVVLLFKYTGFTTSEGTINLAIEVACGDGICNNQENSTTCLEDCGEEEEEEVAPSGGGGGGAGAVIRDFSVDQQIVKVTIKQDESFKTSIKVKNTDKVSQNFEVSLSQNLKDMVFVSDSSFSLLAGEEKIIYLTFTSTSDISPGVYTGNLEIKTSSNSKKIPIVFSIKSKVVLFDVSLDIPAKYKEILPGEEILLQLSLFNLGDLGKTDVHIEYVIKDFEGNTIIEQKDVVAVETQVSFSKTIKLPSTVKPGDYVAIAQARYDESLGSSSVIFHVLERERPLIMFLTNKYFIVISIIIVLAVLFIIFLEYERKKMRDILRIQTREIRKIHERIRKAKHRKGKKIAVKETEEIKEKLRNQHEALENAYKRGYITRNSYLKGKERIENLRKKIQ